MRRIWIYRMKMDQNKYGYRMKMDQKEHGYNTGWKWVKKNNMFTGENEWKEYGCRIKMNKKMDKGWKWIKKNMDIGWKWI